MKTKWKLIIALVLISCALAGMVMLNYSAVFADTSAAPAGYLSIGNMVLQEENGRSTGSLNNPFYRGATSYYGDDVLLYTDRGIHPGSTWEEFVEAYGDCTAYTISFFPEDDEKRIYTDDYYDTHYFNYMKVSDFDRDYVQNGLAALDENVISVEFNAYVYGRTAGYSESQYNDMMHRHYSNNWPDGSLMDPKVQRYYLDLSFCPVQWYWTGLPQDGALYSLTFDRYVY